MVFFRKRSQLPQTKPMGELIVKTMFEHEQHDAGLLGRRARDRAHQRDFGRTNPTDRILPRWQTNPTGGSVTHQPNEPTGHDISANEANFRKRSQSGKSNENNV
jgi:hypothetical protein